jgi:hypothetical protein
MVGAREIRKKRMEQTVDVRGEVNQFFTEGRRRASFNPQQLYLPSLVPTVWA